jgi:hypothetical protein
MGDIREAALSTRRQVPGPAPASACLTNTCASTGPYGGAPPVAFTAGHVEHRGQGGDIAEDVDVAGHGASLPRDRHAYLLVDAAGGVSV